MPLKIKPVPSKRKYPFQNLSLNDMKGEEWRDIAQFEGYIKVSNYGRIWSLPRPIHSIDGHFYYTRELIRKQNLVSVYNPFRRGYRTQLSVHIRYERQSFRFAVNRLVYSLFVRPIDLQENDFPVVHKDGDNCNNRWDNLAIMNWTELYAHDLELNLRPRTTTLVATRAMENSRRPIVKYNLRGRKMHEYPSVAAAADANDTSRTGIRQVATKKVKQLNGFVFRYRGDRYRGEYANASSKKPVTQYTIKGKRIGRYPSVRNAAAQTGIDSDVISKCALKKIRFAGGYVWRYDKEKYAGEYDGKVTNRPLTIVQYSLEGKQMAVFNSVNQASEVTGFAAATLRDCAFKRAKVSHGFVWRFEGEAYRGEYLGYRIGKPVTQRTLEGTKLKTYPTIEAAAKASGLTPDNIQKNVKGANKTAGGFVWSYASPSEVGELPAFQRAAYAGIPRTREIVQYTLEGKKIKGFSSITEASRASKISSTNISFALDKKKRTAGGFVWRTKGNVYHGDLARANLVNKARRVTQYDLKGKKIRVFKSTYEAKKETGISSTSISMVARGKFKMTGGFIWQYGEGQDELDLEKYYASSRQVRERISKAVIKYSLLGEYIAEYPSIAAAARAEKISVNRISNAVNGKTKSAVGFIWRLKNNT